jgi:antitoxin Phd
MATMNISAAREKLPEAVELARTEPVFLERYGRPAAVLVSPEQYEKLLAALEDAQDAEDFDVAMAEEGPNVPWEQVKADLGWT